jgi:DNA-damage-inducible protein D
MPLLGYKQWRRFEDAIDRAKAACQNRGNQVADEFADAGKFIRHGKGVPRKVIDYRLSRFAAYLAVRNGEPRKPETNPADGKLNSDLGE